MTATARLPAGKWDQPRTLKFVMLVVLSSVVCAGTDSALLRYYAYAIAAAFVLGYGWWLAAIRGIVVNPSSVPAFLLLLWVLLRAQDSDGVIAALYVGSLSLMCTLSKSETRASRVEYPLKAGYCIGLVVVVSYFVYGRELWNPNYVAAVAALTLVPFVHYYRNPVNIALLAIVFVTLASRAVLLAIIFAVFSIVILDRDSARIVKFVLAFMGMSIILSAFFLYEWYIANDVYLNNLSLEWTGKRLESGRLNIWRDILSTLDGIEWWIGTGHAFISRSSGDALSEHSSYVYFIYRYGIIGLALLLTVLVLTARELLRRRAHASFIVFVAFAFRDAFEKTITSNSFPMAAFFWLVCGVGALDIGRRFRMRPSERTRSRGREAAMR